jgi:hypothetical protein
MCLHIHSDAFYLSEAHARICAGGTFFFSAQPADPTKHPSAESPQTTYNGAIHTINAIMVNGMASSTEAEFGALFHNARDTAPLRNALVEMGHPQAVALIQTDNAYTAGIANETVKQ